MLQVLNKLKYKPNELSIHLVEISSTMQLLQANRLCATHKESDIELSHNREVINSDEIVFVCTYSVITFYVVVVCKIMFFAG